jgi:type VI secretion system protein ImpL
MRLTWEWLVAVAALIVVLLLVWFMGLTPLKGSDLLILRLGVLFLGLLGITGFLWWANSKKAAQAPPPPARRAAESEAAAAAAGGAAGDVESIIREAAAKLAASKLGKTATLGSLPAVFVVGESRSGKTTIITRSGMEAELLAGHVFGEGDVVPTTCANLWLARRMVFAEAGGPLQNDVPQWMKLVKRLSPKKFGSVFGQRQQAARAAIVCVDCEKLLRSADSVPRMAQQVRARLGEVSQALGISFPVYVLFNRLDAVPFFADFMNLLSSDEAVQVLGASLPYHSHSAGVYAEQEHRRISAAFNNMVYSLCDWRLTMLGRERHEPRLPGSYEFPREFRKLRNVAVQFLVDVNRPSQLRTAPFLRGFYFTGVRQVTVAAPARATATPAASMGAPEISSATRIFSKGDVQALLQAELQAQQAAGGEERQVIQHTFLSHVFSHVILTDHAALGASGASTQVSMLQRVLLGTVAAAGLIFALGFTVSFFNNRGMQSSINAAARAIPSQPIPAGELAGPDALQKLENLRAQLDRLVGYQREGPPWGMRWGLYSGDAVLPEARRVYFDRFHRLMFGQTQSRLVARLAALPEAPAPTDAYGPVYDTLKAYLITTSNPDKSSVAFLSPVLLRAWSDGHNPDAALSELARKQFDFYAEQVRAANPFGSSNDVDTVARARGYLTKFAATQSIYAAMRAAANKQNQPFIYAQKYPEAGGVVANHVEVEGAMTKSGWGFMQEAFKNPQKYFGGEEWVLGSQTAAGVDMNKLAGELRGMYQADYIKVWREYLSKSVVVRYGSLPDAAQKLLKLSGNRSPILTLLCEVSFHTGIDSEQVQKAFQPVQQVVLPACQEQYVQDPNRPYVAALLTLQSCLEQASTQLQTAPADQKDALKAQCMAPASNAKVTTRTMAQGFKIDQEAHIERTVQKLMEDPITAAEALLRPSGPAGAEGLCSSLRGLLAKYPFNPGAQTRATVDEVGAFFGPGGALSAFYEQNLKQIFLLQNGRYIPNPSSPFPIHPPFQSFWERAASVQQAFYPGGSPTPQMRINIRPAPSEGIQSLTLNINGQTQKWSGTTTPFTFLWPGAAPRVTLSARIAGGSELTFLNYEGLWAAFQFFGDAERTTPGPAGSRVEWVLKISGQPVRLPNGEPLRVILDVDSGGAPPVFQRGYFSGFSCVSRVTR